jgi:ribose-phosphate pyrophosphokinase
MTAGLLPSSLLVFDEREWPAASHFAAACGIPALRVARHDFPDGEMRLRLPAELSGRVGFWRSLAQPNDKLVELMIAAPAARALGARELMLICPYLAYMRQDAAFEPGQAVSQRHVGRFITQLFETVVTVDPHLHRIASLGEVMTASRCVVASAAGALGVHAARLRSDPLLVGPDAESAPWVLQAAIAGGHALGRDQPLDHAVCRKLRIGDREVRVELGADVHVAGRAVVLVDDVASTGRTLAESALACLARGALGVDAAVVHAMFGPEDERFLRGCGVGVVWSTDSVPHPSNAIPIGDVIAAALGACGAA